MDYNDYFDLRQDIVARGNAVRSALEALSKDDGSFFIPSSISEQDSRNATRKDAIKGTIFEEIGNGGIQVAAEWTKSLAVYERKHGRKPSLEILAAAHRATENVVKLSHINNRDHCPFGNIDLDFIDGMTVRDHLLSCILPVYLSMITSNMVTYIPADFNQSEFFRIKRIASSTFGDLKKDDIIGCKDMLKVMSQYVEIGVGNNVTTSFTFASETKYGAVVPFKLGRTVLEIDSHEVARDHGEGTIYGCKTINGENYYISGRVDTSKGELSVSITPAPSNGSKVAVAFDVDIQDGPALVPSLEYVDDSRIMYPHEEAFFVPYKNSKAIIQRLGIDLAANKDRIHLMGMYNHVTQVVELKLTRAGGISLREHYETVQQALLTVDSMLADGTGVAGLIGLVAGRKAATLFRYLPAPYFIPSPDYRYVPQPHYVGRLWGSYDLYCDPFADEEWSCLCYARGTEYGQTAYIAGDVVLFQFFNHLPRKDCRGKGFYELAYRDMQPFDGDKYLVKLKLVEA